MQDGSGNGMVCNKHFKSNVALHVHQIQFDLHVKDVSSVRQFAIVNRCPRCRRYFEKFAGITNRMHSGITNAANLCSANVGMAIECVCCQKRLHVIGANCSCISQDISCTCSETLGFSDWSGVYG